MMSVIKVKLRAKPVHHVKLIPPGNAEQKIITVDKSKPHLAEIVKALKSKGINSAGDIAKVADDIAQIKTPHDIDPNEFFRVSEVEEDLSFDLTRDIYPHLSDNKANDIKNSGYGVTNYIDVERFDYINAEQANLYISYYYDKDKVYVSHVKLTKYDKVPQGAKYVRIGVGAFRIPDHIEIKGGKFVIVSKNGG